MRALVTGATGFLGGHLARRLVRAGWDVTGLGRKVEQGRRLEAEGIRFRCQDLRDESGTAAVCSGQDAVFHCAALSSPWGKYRDFYGCNVEATRMLAAASLRQGVRRFIHVSTPSVYFDYTPRLGIHESEPLPVKAANHYAATKRLADQVVKRYHAKGLSSVIIRPRAVFGPYDQALFPRIVAASGKSGVPLIGGGKALIDATYVDNAVDALLNGWDAPEEATGRAYNITNGEPREFAGLVESLFRMLDLPLRTRSISYRKACGAAAVLEGLHRLFPALGEPMLTRYTAGTLALSQTLDITDARTLLGYAPRVSLDEGLWRFAEWWRERS